jgi:hypothetical protein
MTVGGEVRLGATASNLCAWEGGGEGEKTLTRTLTGTRSFWSTCSTVGSGGATEQRAGEAWMASGAGRTRTRVQAWLGEGEGPDRRDPPASKRGREGRERRRWFGPGGKLGRAEEERKEASGLGHAGGEREEVAGPTRPCGRRGKG